MFTDFYYALRTHEIPVSPTEWLIFMKALSEGAVPASMEGFYAVGRALLVKNESDFDRWDRTFLEYFRDVESSAEMMAKILAGLKKVPPKELTEAEKALIQELDLDQILANFEKQYKEGHFVEHVGGNKRIGTGGTSTQGNSGFNKAGVRVGGEGRLRRAVQIAGDRRFRDYSGDRVLDIRSVQLALRRLKKLIPTGPEDDLNLDRTIDSTAKNAGDIDMVWQRRKLPGVRLILLMDSGGSMWPYAELVEILFSAAKGLFRELEFFYFHNCIYDQVWKSFRTGEKLKTAELLHDRPPETKIIFVGDAAMALSELLAENGAIDYFAKNEPGIRWLQRFHDKFQHAAWLNPEPPENWRYTESIQRIARVIPMYPLTLEGLDEAVKDLAGGRRR